MTLSERKSWFIVGAIFVTFFCIWGGINCAAVFFIPVLKAFGWSREKLSVAVSIGWITGGAAGPLIGILADRVNPKKMMIVGAVVTGLVWIGMSSATTFTEYLIYNAIFGISVGASTTIPATLIIAGWFKERRGLPMGIAFAGATIGGAIIAITANFAILSHGWRFGYLTLALPVLIVVVPLILFVVQSAAAHAEASARSEPARPVAAAASPVDLPGLDLAEAVHTRSFWLICVAQGLGGLASGMGAHYVAYLTGIGYSATIAATVISLYLIGTTVGTVVGGPIADKIGARTAMVATFVSATIGMIALMAAAHPLGLVGNIIAGGIAGGAYAVQMPLAIIESLGVKRLGSMMGVTSVFYTFGAFVSPIATGRIFDVTHHYTLAMTAFCVMLPICAIAMAAVLPLNREQAHALHAAVAPDPDATQVR